MEMNFPARIEMGDGYYRVRVGNFTTIDEASNLERRLKMRTLSILTEKYFQIASIKMNAQIYL